MRTIAAVVLISLLALAAPVAAQGGPEPEHCEGDPSTVAVCDCPQGFWGVVVWVQGEPKTFICFF